MVHTDLRDFQATHHKRPHVCLPPVHVSINTHDIHTNADTPPAACTLNKRTYYMKKIEATATARFIKEVRAKSIDIKTSLFIYRF